MADYSPKFTPGRDFTLTAGAAITGGQLLSVSAANTVIPTAAAGVTWIGVARQDAANTAKVVLTRGGVQTLVSNGIIAAGARVVASSAGRVITIGANDASLAVGTALTLSADAGPVVVAMDR